MIVEHYSVGEGQDLPLLKFSLLNQVEGIGHCFTTRDGGVSQGIYESLNLGLSRGDDRDSVVENFRRVADAMEAEVEDFVLSDQTHTTNIRRITREDAGHGLTRPKEFFDVDGMVTDEPGLVLSTFYADCVPLYFVDPVHRAIGLSHSGWRGTVGRIGRETIKIMTEEFGTRPQELLCAIGPSICQDCYEVSEDVAEAFAGEFPESRDLLLRPGKPGKYQLNLWKANRIVLQEAGVEPNHIDTAGLCTCCNPQRLFSHRASQGKRGNLGAFLMIKKTKNG